MSRWSNKKLTKEELEAKWRLNFLSEYAKLKIMNPEGNTIQISDIEKDARRIPTVRKYFISLGWADPEESYWPEIRRLFRRRSGDSFIESTQPRKESDDEPME
jgi:hypothetical protein